MPLKKPAWMGKVQRKFQQFKESRTHRNDFTTEVNLPGKGFSQVRVSGNQVTIQRLDVAGRKPFTLAINELPKRV